MAKIALINIDMHGHVNPTLGLTSELCRRGHQVHFFSSEEFAETVAPTGAIFKAYPSQMGKLTADSAKEQALATAAGKAPPPQASVMRRFIMEFDATFAPLQSQLNLIRPDLVICDFVSLAGKLIAQNLNTPVIKFFTTYASNEHYNLLAESFAKHDYPTPAEIGEAQALIDRACAQVGYESVDLARDMQKLDEHNMVFLPRLLQPRGETFDERFAFVGPCFEPVSSTQALELIPAGDGPVLLISLGSLFHEWPEFYRDCIQAFGNSDWRVVMSIGGRMDRAVLGEIPANIRVEKHIPQVALLPHADAFISHGGMNSTMEALAYGVPLVVIPQIEEQAITAKRVEQMQMGIHIDRADVHADILRTAVDKVYRSDAIRHPVELMRQAIAEAGGPVRAADLAESLLSAATSKSGQSQRTLMTTL